jgi:hypothetical protein
MPYCYSSLHFTLFFTFNFSVLVLHIALTLYSYCNNIWCCLTFKLLLNLSYWLFSFLFLMATFHVIGNLDLTISVANSGVIQVTKNVLCAMFIFRWRSLHVSKDVYYAKDNVVLSYAYQVPDVNSRRMFWTINKARYWIIGKNVLKNLKILF